MGVILRRRGRWYHLDIADGGKRIRKPLHTDDRKKAEIIRNDYESAMLAGEWNVAVAIDTTLARGVERFQKEYESLHHAPSTRKYTAGVFRRFQIFMSKLKSGEVTVDAVRKDDFEAYQLARSKEVSSRKTVISASTVNRDLRELSTMFSWAKSLGICRRNPCKGVKPLRGIKRKIIPLSPTEIAKLLEALGDVWADLARLILNTGCRLGEATHLRVTDISLERKLLLIRSRPDYLIKAREEREIPLVEPALAVCRRRMLSAGRSGLLFHTSEGTLLNNRNARRSLYAACKSAGIRRVSWYLLRKTFASVQAKILTPSELQVILGHADIRTSAQYYISLRGAECRLKEVVG
jgi:integrase